MGVKCKNVENFLLHILLGMLFLAKKILENHFCSDIWMLNITLLFCLIFKLKYAVFIKWLKAHMTIKVK